MSGNSVIEYLALRVVSGLRDQPSITLGDPAPSPHVPAEVETIVTSMINDRNWPWWGSFIGDQAVSAAHDLGSTRAHFSEAVQATLAADPQYARLLGAAKPPAIAGAQAPA